MKPTPRTFFHVLPLLLVSACHGPSASAHAPRAEPEPRPETPGAVSGAVYVPGLLGEGLRAPQAYALLEELTRVAPHRLAGSAGAALALEWGRATMERLGFDAVRLEPCRVPHWERGAPEELVVVEPASHAGERLSVLALGGSVATPMNGVEAEVMAVTSFEELHARAAEARDRIVFLRRPMDPATFEPFEAYGGAVNQRGAGASEAAAVGARAVLVRSMTTRHDDEAHTGALRYAEGVERIPAAAVSLLASERISEWLDAGETVRLRLTLACRWFEDADSFNVVGDIRGRERPEEIVLIGAHLDAWDVGQGAHDDGAGCAHVLEAGRLLASSALGRPRRTVRCVLYMNEENGLRGGQAYRDLHAAELGLHVLAIESDRGGGVPMGYTTDGSGQSAALLARLYGGQACARGGGADISVLAAAGVTMAGLYPNPQRYFDFHHSENDVLAAVHPRELELGAISLASLAYLAADHDGDWPRAVPQE